MSARTWALPGIGAVLACSTVAAPRQDRYCVADDDCLSGQVCSNNTCYESELPSEAAIALDIRDDGFFSPAFRVEILGEDLAVAQILDDPPNRYYVNLSQNGDKRPAVRDELELSLIETRTQLGPDEEAEAPLTASIELQQASRFGRAPLLITGLKYPEPDPVTMEAPAAPRPLVQPWPRYDPPELHEGAPFSSFYTELPLYIQITPQDDVADADAPDPEQKLYSRGIIHRQLLAKKQGGAGAQPFVVSSVRECHRKITSRVRFPGGAPPFVDKAQITINGRHATRDDDDDPTTPICDQGKSQGQLATCSPATILEQPNNRCETDNECAEPYRCYPDPVDDVDRCGCMLDGDCPSGQICNVEHQLCALDLSDRLALKPVTVKSSNDALVDAWVYTYCDEDPTRDHALELVVSVTPDTRLGLPSLRYRGFVDFLYSEFMAGVGAPMKFICLPTWDLPRTVALDLRGSPIAAAILDSTRTWSCCDTACLTGDVAVSSPESCAVKQATIGASGEFTPPEPAKWDDSCMDLHGADEHGAVRVSYPGRTCADDKPCTIDLSPGPLGGDGQDYRLRIEPPVGSIFRSTSYALKVGAGTSLEPISLDYRVLLRGQVLDGCREGDPAEIECSAAAEIVAERIIRDEDPATLLGPFFYTTSTISGTEGEYVLPLNPGVYLLTALPKLNASGSQTGPAPIRVIDLREGSSELTLDPGTGVLLASAELVLAPGAVYNLELDNFALSSRVVPLDLSSWSGLRFENKEIDLNAPGTCSLSEGCQIRRLRPGNSPARLSQEQFLRYVARSVDAE